MAPATQAQQANCKVWMQMLKQMTSVHDGRCAALHGKN
jgi:hypothetical protein